MPLTGEERTPEAIIIEVVSKTSIRPSLRKALFESVGGFPDTPIAEDLYLVRRLLKKGTVRIAPAPVITSARRWQTLGVLRTSLINVLIATAITLGFSPNRFVSLYGNDKPRLYS